MHPHALAYTLAVSHRKSIFIFTKTILAFNSIPGVGVQKSVPVEIITIGEICFQLNLIQKIFMGLSEQILPLHIIASRATCPVSKQPGSILAGKGAVQIILFQRIILPRD